MSSVAIGSQEAMKCLYASNSDKNDEPKITKSISFRSYTFTTSMPTNHDTKKSESEFNSQNASDFSTEPSTRNSFAVLSQRQINPIVFTFWELKTATKNFSRSLIIGEDGFGGVYRGVIQSTEDNHKKIDIAVKQ